MLNVRAYEGLLYVAVYGSKVGARPQMMVFDVRDPQRFEPIGHIAFPEAIDIRHVQPLADGRVVAGGGNVLCLISPPPKRD